MLADTVKHRGREFISVTVPHYRSPSENTHSYREGEWQDDCVIIHGWAADEHTQIKKNKMK